MVEKDRMIKLYIKGFSKSEIARKTKRAFNTVDKYITEYEMYEKAIMETDSEKEKEDLIIKSNAKPSYDTSKRTKRVMTKEVTDRIDELIEINHQRERAGLRKQVMKATDMHRTLEKEKFEVSYRSVSEYVRNVNKKSKEAFVKSDNPPGFAAEFDWGDVSLIIDEVSDRLRRYKLGVFALKHSTRVYSDLYLNENTESFLDIHANYFELLEGVPHQITYDNARVQVKRFTGTLKLPTDALVKLTNYYGYKHRFANVCSGNEKGTVERYVDVVRIRAFSKNIHFKTLQEARDALKIAIEELNVSVK